MTDNIDKTVLMKCATCGFEEKVPLKDIKLLREFYAPFEEDHILCPLCINNMFRKDSRHFKKDEE